MFQTGVHADRFAKLRTGAIPQIHEKIMLIMLSFQSPGRIDEKVWSEGGGHLVHDRFEIRMTGDDMLFVRLRVLNQFLA